MSPADFERLVAGLLQELYDCDVLHVGRSHDEGIDVILIESNDGKIPIQVKHHMRPGLSESVSVVREFRGAMLLHGFVKGMIVTAADHFSRAALEASKPKPTHLIEQRIDLIDARRLLDILGLVGSRSSVCKPSSFSIQPNAEALAKIQKEAATSQSKPDQLPLGEDDWARETPTDSICRKCGREPVYIRVFKLALGGERDYESPEDGLCIKCYKD